jgi:thiamine-monophosphate kinase
VGDGELEAIRAIRSLLPPLGPGEIGIGDDAAAVRIRGGHDDDPLLLAADALVEGVHFDLGLSTLADVGWKALAVNVSDIAAMGGTPLDALVTLVVPRALPLAGFYEGLAESAEEYGCRVVGGDLSTSPGDTLCVSVALTGRCDGHQPVSRAGARPGDTVFVTGPLGASAAGLRFLISPLAKSVPDVTERLIAAHRRPRARVREGIAAARAGASAMIDVSDGLATDLGHLAVASNVGVRLSEVPVAEGAELEEAIGGGEDYELLFAAPAPAVVRAAFAEAGLRAPIEIGTCVETDGAPVITLDGHELSGKGYEHLIMW